MRCLGAPLGQPLPVLPACSSGPGWLSKYTFCTGPHITLQGVPALIATLPFIPTALRIVITACVLRSYRL